MAALANQNAFDSLFTILTQKYSVAGDPSGTTLLVVDSVGIGNLVLLSAELRALSYGLSKGPYAGLMLRYVGATALF